MARENGILADKFNTCLLDEPIPLRVYKDLKKEDIPRFRPRSLRDYIRNKIKYSNISDTLDKTAYDKTDLEDQIRHWFTEAKRHDYVLAQAFQEMEEQLGPDWEENFERDLQAQLQGREFNDRQQYVRTPGGIAPPQNLVNYSVQSDEEDRDEEEVKSEQSFPVAPDSGDSAVVYTGRATRGQSPTLGQNSPTRTQQIRTPPTFLHGTNLQVIRPMPSPPTLERNIEDLPV